MWKLKLTKNNLNIDKTIKMFSELAKYRSKGQYSKMPYVFFISWFFYGSVFHTIPVWNPSMDWLTTSEPEWCYQKFISLIFHPGGLNALAALKRQRTYSCFTIINHVCYSGNLNCQHRIFCFISILHNFKWCFVPKYFQYCAYKVLVPTHKFCSMMSFFLCMYSI